MSNTAIPDDAFSGMESLTGLTVSDEVTHIGANAFNGCSSLEPLTLNSVESIGVNAFNGCDNITSITINTKSKTQPVAASRAADAGITDASFAGANPNCLVFVSDEKLAASLSGVNVVYTGDSENSDRKALTDIRLKSGYVFNTPGSFNLGDKTITYEVELKHKVDGSGNWTGVTLPFAPSRVIVDGIDHTIAREGENTVSVLSFDGEDAAEFGSQDAMAPNRPYVARINSSGSAASSVVFSATAKGAAAGDTPATESFDVQLTPADEEIAAAGKDFTLYGSFAPRKVTEADYMLDDACAKFVLVTDASEAGEVAPFGVYVRANSADAPFETDIVPGETSSIDGIGVSLDNGMRIYRDGDSLTIFSDVEDRLFVYDIAGRLIKVLEVKAGSNDIELPAGIYMINGMKIML